VCRSWEILEEPEPDDPLAKSWATNMTQLLEPERLVDKETHDLFVKKRRGKGTLQ
jgi:hypothetical protein